jgi:hypothetical protein
MLHRLPSRQAILQVYAVIAVMLSGWTITAFLWKLSAWLLILNLGEILTVFSYSMLVSFFEGLIVLLLLLGSCVLFPFAFLREGFEVRGTILAIGLIGSLMAFVRFDMEFGVGMGVKLLLAPFVVLLLTAILLGLSPKFHVVQRFHSVIRWTTDRMLVFLYILVPLFVFVFAYVIFRNIT